ncbi:SNF2-related protein [Candidatus Neomarinimicrobiota bacterium]
MRRTTSQIQVPWSIYISRLEDILACERLNGDTVLPSERAQLLLNYAEENRLRYLSHEELPELATDEIENILRQKGFKRPLKPYQLSNVSKLSKFRSGATFSVPGAGKTTEALAFFYLHAEPEDLLLVIAPINAFGAWDQELQDCFNDKKLFFQPITTTDETKVNEILRSGQKRYIVNYHKLPILTNVIAQFLSRHPVFLFLDESHYIKSEASLRGSAAIKIAHLPKSKLILTGTPIPQHIEDLIPQFKYLYPEIRVSSSTVDKAFRPIFVRTPRSALGIKDGELKQIVIPFSRNQREIYNLFKNDILSKLDFSLASELIRIKRAVVLIMQLVSNPLLLLDRFLNITDFPTELLENLTSPKIDYACQRARELAREGMKSIIWSSFVKNVDTITDRLKDLNAVKIRGGVSSLDRREAVKRFTKTKECMAIVINPSAGSEGISLHHKCHYAIYVDRSFNSVHWLQSLDRIRRIGQEELPIFEVLIHEKTIDDRIQIRLDEKISLMEKILNDSTINIENIAVEYIDDEDTYAYKGIEIDNDDLRYAIDALKGE